MLHWMDIEDARDCIYDSLSIYERRRAPETWELLEKLCGTSVGDAYLTTKRQAKLVFESDFIFVNTGFELSYRFYRKGKI